MDKQLLFIEKIKKIYPQHWETVAKELSTPRKTTFRMVLTKPSVDSTLAAVKSSAPVENGPFPNSYVFMGSESSVLDVPGIYIQGFASMIPVTLININAGDEVLELCAAPGSKSSQLAGMFNDEVHITCVDNNSSRLYALKDNMEKQNIHNYETLKTDAAVLQYKPQYTEKFDAVIADVPCSNEGNIRLCDSKSLERWNPKLPKKIAQLQKKIISGGIKALKKGGRLVYSTCTYSIEENEEVVDWVLRTFPEMRLETVKLDLPNLNKGITTNGKKSFDPEISKCLRIIPNELFDGFFVASLLKF